MDGETNIDTRKGTFGAASLWAKTKILFAGVAMNWLLAAIIFTILAWTGMPEMLDNQYRVESDTTYENTSAVVIEEIFKDTPAEKSELKVSDQITKISTSDKKDSVEVHTSADLQDFNRNHAGQDVIYNIRHIEESGEITEKEVAIKLNEESEKYILGISMSQFGLNRYRATWSAPIVGIVNTVQLTGETYSGLGQLVGNIFSGVANQFSPDETTREEGKAKIEAAGDSVSGPVGIIGVLFPAIAQTGVTNVLFLTAIISISLACMNVLPIPALDGGRWFLIVLFRLLKRPLTPETENKIVSRAFMVLLILAGFITILDVMKILR